MANLSHLTKLLAAFDVQEESATDFQSKHENLQVIVTDPITKIDHRSKVVMSESGRKYGYDYLCLCHGARPKVISTSSPYVIGIRDTQSVVHFQEKLKNSTRVMVVGNGGIATEILEKSNFKSPPHL